MRTAAGMHGTPRLELSGRSTHIWQSILRIDRPSDMSKTAKNLYLDPDVVERAEEYGRRQGTSVSALVSDYLDALTRPPADQRHGPLVQRLRGAGVPRGEANRKSRRRPRIEDYRRHLDKKYGRK